MPRIGGRGKGTPNKRTAEFRDRFDEVSKARGFDIIETLIDMSSDPDLAIEHRQAAMKIVLPYAFPRLKATEVEVVEPVRVIIHDATEPPEDPLS